MGHGMVPIQRFLDRGLRPSLSVDVETNVPRDMISQKRTDHGIKTRLNLRAKIERQRELAQHYHNA